MNPLNPLAGKPLRYLIGADSAGQGKDGEITAVPYGDPPVRHGISIAYCNLFDEENTGRLGPYLKDTDTAREYGEGVIDPRGTGWIKNLEMQFRRRNQQGFKYIELDNADAYSISDVIGAIELAATYGLKVIAKNPCLLGGGSVKYVAHPSIYGIIVERDEDVTPLDMEQLRRGAGKPDLPVWFVAFGRKGKSWADGVAHTAKNYRNMGVTVSRRGEYTDSIDILRPHT